jgi:hypothetical protein
LELAAYLRARQAEAGLAPASDRRTIRLEQAAGALAALERVWAAVPERDSESAGQPVSPSASQPVS